jgi:alanine racemase
MARPAVARISRRSLRHNAGRVRALAPHSRLLACVKADGYGHGLTRVAGALSGHCDGFAVACLEEALALRSAGIAEPVVLLEGVLEADEWPLAAQHGLTVCVNAAQQIDWLEAQALASHVACWLKVDTGMHRLGVTPQAVPELLDRLQRGPVGREPIVLLTHFASADQREESTAQAQLAQFTAATQGLSQPRSTANSAAIMRMPETHLDWVRPGYMLYGGSPFGDETAAQHDLRPAMEFESAVIALRDVPRGEAVGYGGRWVARRPSRIATVAAGYGDGYPRHAPDGTPVLVAGQRAALAGRVSMDMITVDVTDLSQVTVGSPVLLWGAALPVDEVADAAGTIGYELLAGMPPRVPRIDAD